MTPKEKAMELIFKKYGLLLGGKIDDDKVSLTNKQFIKSKKFALIAVDEILKLFNDYWNQDCKINQTKIGYFEEVKQEIENYENISFRFMCWSSAF